MKGIFNLLLALVFSALARPTAANQRFLVRIGPVARGGETAEQLFDRLGLRVVREVGAADGSVYLVSASGDLPESVVREMRSIEPRLREMEAVRKLRLPASRTSGSRDEVLGRAERFAEDAATASSESDLHARYLGQPASRSLKLRAVHRYYGRGRGIVAVIDSGVDPDHPVLAESLVPGYDFVLDQPGAASEWTELDPDLSSQLQQSTVAVLNQSTVAVLNQSTVAVLNQSTVAVLNQSTVAVLNQDAYRAFGHGTLVAGLVHLVAPRARIMPLKAFRADGSSSTADIVDAIYFAVAHGADVINMSFSFEVFSPEVMRAVNYATRHGVVCVAAAGNSGEPALVFPASLENVTGVAATTAHHDLSPISSYGEDLVSVATIGEEVLSTYPGGRYASVFGTSFSTAIVAGAVAVVHQVDRRLDPSDVETAFGMGRPRSGDLGYGELDLLGALDWVRKERRDRNHDDDRQKR